MSKLNIPELAVSVFQKQTGKKHAFAVASACYGRDGMEALSIELRALRARFLPKPGTVRRTSDGRYYAVAPDGSLRHVSHVEGENWKAAA